MAAIELPAGSGGTPGARKRAGHPKNEPVLCLPKGLVDAGEKPLEAALREVREETGITAVPITKLADIKYVYVRSWGDGERVFKIVSFYLLRYESGRIDDVSEAMRIEVACAKWVRLEDAPKLLAYRGEKQMARQALEYVSTQPELRPAL
jgi:8-oxo-dGTP pyrophosphatase MutT (NUDIX family)